MSFMDRFGFAEGSFAVVAITPPLRSAVLRAWNGKCAYCEQAEAEHVDHIIPHAKGGPDCLENFTAACARCNLKKTDLILPDGVLAILLAKARRKAPKIEGDLASRGAPAPDREGERQKLVAELRVLGAEKGETFDMEAASITSLKQEISKAKRRIKARQKEQEITAGIAELIAKRSETAPCPTVALLLTERARSHGELGTPAKIQAAIKRAEKPSQARGTHREGVILAMPPEVQQELRGLLERHGVQDERREVPYSRSETPKLYEHLLDCRYAPSARIAGWRMNLLPGWSCREAEGTGTLSVDGPMLEALRRAEALGVDAFSFKNLFRLDRIPPLTHCNTAPPSMTA